MIKKILVSKSETNKELYNILERSKWVQPVYTDLKIGDYVFDEFVIERKTYPDFVNSIRDNRLFNQVVMNFAQVIEDGYIPILLLEGNINSVSRRSNPIEINGLKNFIQLQLKIPLMETTTPRDSAFRMISLSLRNGLEDNFLKPYRKAVGVKWKTRDQQVYILRGFRGLGDVRIDELLKKHKYNLIDILVDLSERDTDRKIYKEIKKIILGKSK